jgi:hypothetical protein
MLPNSRKSVSEDGDIWRAAAASGLHLHVTGVSFLLDSGHRHVFRWTADGMKVATTSPAGVMQAQPSASKLKLDSLFLQWFSMPETQRLVRVGGGDAQQFR